MEVSNPKKNKLADAFNPKKNGVADAFNPKKNGVADAFDPKKHKWSQKDTIITAVVVSICIIIVVFMLLLKYICFSNGQPKADNGQCCPYGVTRHRKQCYLTKCTGVRNKNGICCPNGVTKTYKINCINTECPPDDVVNGICCLYGKTHFKINCILTECDGTRTVDDVCCNNGLADNDATCNQPCPEGSNSFNGKCCGHGVAENNTQCKTKACEEYDYTHSGMCCTNGATVNKRVCNIPCINGIYNIGTTQLGKQICCPNGINDNAKNASTMCKTMTCNKPDAEVSQYGKCCLNGVATNNIYCKQTCADPKSVYTISGQCCPPQYGLNNANKCYTTTCDVKKGESRDKNGVCCTNGVDVSGICNDPCPKYGSNTNYGKCCPHGIAPGVYSSYKLCNQTCTTVKGSKAVNAAQNNTKIQDKKSGGSGKKESGKKSGKQSGDKKEDIDTTATFTHGEHSVMGQCCKSGLTTKSWKYCNEVCRSITVTFANKTELQEEKEQAMNKTHQYLPEAEQAIIAYGEEFASLMFPIYKNYIKPYVQPYVQEFKKDIIDPMMAQIQHIEEDAENILPYEGKVLNMFLKIEHVLHPMNPLYNINSDGDSKKGSKKGSKRGKPSGGSGAAKLSSKVSGAANGSGKQHRDLNAQHLSTGVCCTYGMTANEKACFTTSCPKPKDRLLNNSKVCCNATEGKKNCKTETIQNLITDIERSGVLLGAVAYKCGNRGVCGYNKLKCAPNCTKQVSFFCGCCAGDNTCLTDILGACGTKWGGVCWPK